MRKSICFLPLLLLYMFQSLGQTTLHVPGTYSSIQAAVNASSNPMDVVQVEAGVYSAPVAISRSLILRGPNAGNSGIGIRSAEAVIFDASITVSGNVNVQIDGIKIQQTGNAANVCQLGGSAAVIIQNCVVERLGITPGATSRGIVTSAGPGLKTIQQNLFTGDPSGGLFSGHKSWNSGIYLNASGSSVNILNNEFRNCRTAINLDDFNAGIILSGNRFDNNGTHLSFGGVTPTAGQYIMPSNEFVNLNGLFINLSNVSDDFRLDISSSTLGGNSISSYALSTLFKVEESMFHRGRSGRNGLVTYIAGRQFVVQINPSIQAAIRYGQSGEIIHVGPGTFGESISLDKKISIIGSGSGEDPSVNTILSQNAAASGDPLTGVIQLAASGTAADKLILRGLRIKPTGMAGISVGKFTLATATQVSHVMLDNVVVQGSSQPSPCSEQERGLYVDLNSSLDELTVTNCVFRNLNYGWYFHKQVSTNTSSVNNMTVTGSEFSDNALKGLYAEKMSNALFDGCIIRNNGATAWTGSGCNQFRTFLCGFDINLKAGNYQNISIRNSEFTGNGTGQSRDGSALAVKARSDAPSYNGFPASLSGFTVSNCLISGNERGIRFIGTGPLTEAVVSNNSIQGNVKQYTGSDGAAYGNITNSTSAVINATCNWFGSSQADAISSTLSGAITFSPFLSGGADASTATGFQPSASCGEPQTCQFTVVCSNQGKMYNGGNISAARSDASLALIPQKSDASGTVNFFSLGFAGSVTLKSSCPVRNGAGNDIAIWETTFGRVSINALSERARIYASQDGIHFFPLGTATYDGSFDLETAGLAWASFFRIQDATQAVGGQAANADGYDVDGIEVLNGYADETTPAPAISGGASSVCGFTQGKTRNLVGISPSRSNASKALGLPQNDQTINFVSLGFGGEICLKFDFAIFDGPGGELRMVETTFGNSTCSSYPEKAEVSVSFDGINWKVLGIFCQDSQEAIDITPSNSGIQYVKIKDVSSRSDFSSAQADGFDLDAMVSVSSVEGNGPCAPNSNGRSNVNLYDEKAVMDEILPLTMMAGGNHNSPEIRFTRIEESALIEIRNAMGQLMDVHQSSGDQWSEAVVSMPEKAMAPGVYFISLKQGSEIETLRFIR